MTLAATALSVRYSRFVALHETDLRFMPGDYVALLGPNGAGKTTLIRALGGLAESAGEVSWNGESLKNLDRKRRARTIAYLPQSPVLPWPLTVRDLASLGRLPHRRNASAFGAEDHEAIDRALQTTGMSHLADRRMDQLSGGEKMRAHIARTLAVEAPVILVDEPLAGLDPEHQLLVMQKLAELAHAGRIVVVVMHDLALTARFCTRTVLLNAGKVVADGAPESDLTGDTLEPVYRVRIHRSRHEGELLVVPWQRTET